MLEFLLIFIFIIVYVLLIFIIISIIIFIMYIMLLVLVSQSCHNKLPQIWWLKHQFILSHFWRPEVLNLGVGFIPQFQHHQGVSKQGSFILEALKENPFHASPWHSLACRHITPVSVVIFTWNSPLFSVFHSLSFLRTSVIGFRVHPYVGQSYLEIFNYICKGSFTK